MTELMADMTKVGGEKYARLAALAYRQTLAAHKLVADFDGTPMFFPKENFSNGCISTVDVIYPSSPFPLLFNPTLVRAQLEPVMQYAAMGALEMAVRAARSGHLSAGQRPGLRRRRADRSESDAGGRERQHADHDGGAWPRWKATRRSPKSIGRSCTKWAEYLKEKGLDPENQLSTDDFAGHLAHNANLSIKAILALGSYSMLAEMTGHKQEAARISQRRPRSSRKKWQDLAANGDHYRLAFDKAGHVEPEVQPGLGPDCWG